MLLRVVADLEPVAGLDLAGVGLVDAREDPQQRGLAGAVEAEHDDLRPAVDREIDIREDLERSVRLRQPRRHERGLAAGRGLREPQLRDAILLPHVVEAREHLLGARHHLVRGGRLRRLRAEARGLQLQLRRLLLDVDALLLAALLVGHPLAQVVLPVHVVDVDDLAVRVEVEDAVDGLADELDIVADDDEPALVVLEELAQPHHAVGVEVVGRLVEDHRLGVREQDAGELDAAALTARERPQLLVEDAVGQREVVRDRCRLGLGGVAAERLEALGEIRVLPHRPGRDIRIVVAHREGCLVHAERDRAESAGIEDAGAREHVGVARCAGPAAGSRARRMRSTLPSAGSRSPASTLVSVVLPAPLRPTRPILSPLLTRNDTSDMRTRAPTRISRSCTASTANVRFVRRRGTKGPDGPAP